jgi:hypothetical protein
MTLIFAVFFAFIREQKNIFDTSPTFRLSRAARTSYCQIHKDDWFLVLCQLLNKMSDGLPHSRILRAWKKLPPAM